MYVLLWSTVATVDVDDVDRTFLFRENTHFSIAYVSTLFILSWSVAEQKRHEYKINISTRAYFHACMTPWIL